MIFNNNFSSFLNNNNVASFRKIVGMSYGSSSVGVDDYYSFNNKYFNIIDSDTTTPKLKSLKNFNCDIYLWGKWDLVTTTSRFFYPVINYYVNEVLIETISFPDAITSISVFAEQPQFKIIHTHFSPNDTIRFYATFDKYPSGSGTIDRMHDIICGGFINLLE